MNWKYWLFLALMTAFLVAFVSFGEGDIGRGKTPWAAWLCFVALIAMATFGLVFAAGYLRNKALSYALLAYLGVTTSLLDWLDGRRWVGLIIWMVFALLSAYISWQHWKTGKARTGSLASGKGND